jgi:hypothetical protein
VMLPCNASIFHLHVIVIVGYGFSQTAISVLASIGALT